MVATTTQEGRCPCAARRSWPAAADEVIIRNAILRVESATGRVVAKCARCKSWVEVPLKYVE